MREVWMPIKLYQMFAFDGRYKYEVSNLGRVRKAGYFGSRRTFYEPHILSQVVNRNGHSVVNLSCDGHHHTCAVHRLVAISFLKQPDGTEYVIHRDGNKQNNAVTNLKWVSIAEYKATLAPSNMRMKAVRQYTLDGEFVAEYASCAAASKAIGRVNASSISRCCRGVACHKTSAGFIWRYVEGGSSSERDMENNPGECSCS